MKTKKLIKRTAAFCLTLAGFCAAQSAFAEVTVPEWQNSYTSAPTQAFYLYNTAKGKFATNSLTLLDDESKATTWTYSSKKLGTNGQYFARGGLFAGYPLTIGNSGIDFTLDYTQSDDKWGIYFTSGRNNYYVQAATQLQFGEGNAKIYEWYFISTTQYGNHNAIVAAKNGVFAEANQLLEAAEEGDAKTALSNAITTAETAINSVNIENAEAVTTINDAVAELRYAIAVYKQFGLNQYVEALRITLNVAANYDGPEFGFLKDALSEANTAMNADPKNADDLDTANKNLTAALNLARTIVEDEAFTTYQNNIAMIGDNIEKASDYTSYATELTGVKSQAEKDFLAITSVAGLTDINNTLKNANDAFGDKLNLCNAAWAVATQANAVGYEEGFVTVKALTSKDITAANIKTTINNIRNSAKDGVRSYIATYIGLNPIDMTIFINNNSFELGDMTGWSIATNASSIGGSPDNGVRMNEQNYATSDGHGSYLYNTWKEYYGNSAGFGVYQYITGLPNGKYKLEALLTSDPGNKIYLTVDAEKNKQTRVGEGVISENGKGEFVEVSCEFSVKDKAVTIGAIGEQKSSLYDAWFRADNFRLTLLPATMDEDGNEKPSDYTSGDVMPVVKVNRTIKANQWTTLCLPMECAKPESLTLYEVADETQDENGRISVTVAASSDEKIKAGKPYIVKNADAVISEFIANGVSLVEAPTPAGEYIPFTGLFTTTELNAGDIYVSTSADNAEGDKPVYKSLSETASNKNMKGFRAYFQVPAETAESSVRFVTEGDLTGIMQAIEEQQTATGIYDLSGRKASTLQKGIYVIDGKKIIIK